MPTCLTTPRTGDRASVASERWWAGRAICDCQSSRSAKIADGRIELLGLLHVADVSRVGDHR